MSRREAARARVALDAPLEAERYELLAPPIWSFELDRREFLQIAGTGLLITLIASDLAAAQQRGDRGERAPDRLGDRLLLGADGIVTVLCGKVEVGQGSRTQIAAAAAEELRVPLEQIRVVLADSARTPDDGGTYGSRTTPSTVPAVRAACASARTLREAASTNAGRALTYAELAQLDEAALRATVDRAVQLTPVESWTVLGNSTPRVSGREVVTGAHRHPSDLVVPGMLHGVVLRPPSYGATLESIDLGPAQKLDGVVAVRDGEFVGFAAPTSLLARQARDAAAATARWKNADHPSSDDLFDRLVQTASPGGGRSRPRDRGSPKQAMETAAKVHRARYTIAYVQHAPLEPRAALAEWQDGKLTVHTGTQNPSRVREELAQAFRLAPQDVRVVVPDTGGAFGGKHTGEVAVEAARLAREAKRPVSLQWSREEEFTWAYFRPAGVIDVAAGLDATGRVTAWEQRNWNSGGSAIETPYAIEHVASETLASEAPLRQGSYRALAATANVFAREGFMDELAADAGVDPLDFRLQHLEDERLRAVLEAAAERFGWRDRRRALAHDGDGSNGKEQRERRGVGLSCGTEKGSYVAACAEVVVDEKGRYRVTEVCQAFECGAIHDPANLRSQNEGCIVQGLGAVLREEIRFQDGAIENPRFSKYFVPRFRDLPALDVVLLDRKDLASAGGSETPIVAVAPAVANALWHATGERLRALPLKSDKLEAG